MAYDSAKAREYYEKYVKRGLKKGRKKSKGKKKGTSISLIGLSSSGLNDNGRIEAGIIKDRIKKEMNAVISKAKTPEEKERIRAEYSKKAQEAINTLKSDSQYAKPKAAKAAKTEKATKTGSSKSKSSESEALAKSTMNKTEIKQLKKQIENLHEMTATATDVQKEKLKKVMESILKTLKKMNNISKSENKKYKQYIEEN